MTAAVVRKWEASVARSDIDAWYAAYAGRVVPMLQAAEGFAGVSVLLSREDDPCRITVLSRWDNMSAVERFAGPEPAKTVLPDYMADFYADYDQTATFHDQVLEVMA